MRPLPADFYDRPVLEVARELIGCTVEHRGVAGVIVETEAYHESEPACHAFAGLTPRTETLFGAPGRAYVYRSYGVHALLNAVCEPEGVGAAVLIRALAPLSGVEQMLARRKASPRPAVALDGRRGSEPLCSGPGKLTAAPPLMASTANVNRRTVEVRPWSQYSLQQFSAARRCSRAWSRSRPTSDISRSSGACASSRSPS